MAIMISQETFLEKLDYDEVIGCLRCLAPGWAESFVKMKEAVESLFSAILDGFVVEVMGGNF